MSLCILTAGKITSMAAATFTLAWTHTVERVPWEEDWRLDGDALVLVEARVKGSGAGMEPPAEAVLENGWWRYRPILEPQRALSLAVSDAAPGGWRICAEGVCRTIGGPTEQQGPITLFACPAGDAQSAEARLHMKGNGNGHR